MNHRSSLRQVIRHWVLAAACGLSLAVAATGCDKKTDNQAKADGQTPVPAGSRIVGVLDPNKMINTMGWAVEQQKQHEAIVSEVERQLKSFREALNKAVTDERAKVNKTANLKADQIELLNAGQLDKLNLPKDLRDEYILVISRANELNQRGTQAAYNAVQNWDQQVGQMYTEASKPAVRRAADALGVQVVLLSNTVFYPNPSADITDKVIDELQKAQPSRNFPAAPDLKYPTIQLTELSSPTTQPTMPNVAAPATKPSR